MARFHDLEVTDVRKTIRDAVVVTLRPVNGAAEEFDFTQGQYLTFRQEFDGEELRRSYSICAGKDEGILQVGIKKVEGGAFSSWANEELQPGMVLEAMEPMGSFHTVLDPRAQKSYLGFAGGSGITPVLSIIKTVLVREARATFTLVYANRQLGSIMFRERLEDLKNQYLGRLSVIHILEAEGQDVELFTGRVDAEKIDQLFCHWIDAGRIDLAFICGPEPMMLTIAEGLRRHGIPDERIKFELFATGQPGRLAKQVEATASASEEAAVEVSVTLDGATRQFRMPRQGTTVLAAALANDLDAPYACTAGVCSTCRAKVSEGEVEMMVNHALEDYEVRAGYVLTCQCLPVSDRLVLSYDG